MGQKNSVKWFSEITQALRQPELFKAPEEVQLEMQLCQRARPDPRAPGSTCTAVEGALQDGDRDLLPQGTPDGHHAVPAVHTCHVDDPSCIEKEVSTHTWTAETGEKHT